MTINANNRDEKRQRTLRGRIAKGVATVWVAFFMAYIVAWLLKVVPSPNTITCSWFGVGCEEVYTKRCDGRISRQHPVVDCDFVKYKGHDVRFHLGFAPATGATYTVLILTPQEAKNSPRQAVSECKDARYPFRWCTSGYGQRETDIPFPQQDAAGHLLPDGKYVFRISYRSADSGATQFTTEISSK